MSEPDATPITGAEAQADPATPIGALSEFYRAFNGRDLALMAQNWLATDEASMDNPLGGIRRGWPAIAEVYRRLFDGEGRVRVEFHDYTLHVFADVFLAVGRERGRFTGRGESLELAIRTSRFFRKADGRWRQLHHHGSIEDADVLTRYRAAVS